MKTVKNGIIKFILALLIAAGCIYIGIEALPTIKLGLDLNGGVSITYQSVTPNPTQEQMSDAIYKLQLKAQDYSTEAEVYQEGNDKIDIDIPGVSDANKILEELGEPGNLYFVEGNLTWPIATASVASPSVATSSNANVSTSSNIASSILGGNVNIEGANVYQNPDGSITIGGDAQEGATLLQSGETQYDYTQKPSFDESQIVLTGHDVVSAKGGMYNDSNGQIVYAVDLVFSEEGKTKFAEATTRNLGQVIYILYNGSVVSAPTVQAEIADGRAQITGMESLETADRLASTIRIGALPIELAELRSNVVGAKLGQDAISSSLKAGLIGLIIVCIFMILIYRLPGFASGISLFIYVGLMLFLLQAFSVTLTLPGIAGIILSIGMAVDANVVIFARIKEELGIGKNVKSAVSDGFNKALSAILDGNITTLIASAVLFIRGTGSIKGFATTLALGIALSMFTAIFVTKFILKAFVDMRLENKILYGVSKEKEAKPFVNIRKMTYAISIVIIVIGLATIIMNIASGKTAFNYGIDFAGGAQTTLTFDEELDNEQVNKDIVPLFEQVIHEGVQTQTVKGTNEVIIKSRDLTLEEREELYELISSPSIAKHSLMEDSEIQVENISGAVSSQMRMDAIVAVILASIFMLIYIWFRFKDIRFASSAVIALIHDCMVTISFYAIFRWTVDSNFIACMLTIVGYSINATIIIFDRIRENLTKMRGTALDKIINTSITQTLSRSVNTSLTTFIMVLMIYLLGVTNIKMFALPLMIGIVAGAYSSIFITGPLWYDMKKSKNTDKEVNQYKSQNKKDDVDVIKESIKQERQNKKNK